MKTMARKSLALVLAVLLAVGVWGMAGVSLSTVSAASSGDYTYTTLADGTLSITGYTGSARDLVIPDELDGTPVTSISNNAFQDNRELYSVVIPEGITEIGAQAFYGCGNLGDIDLPSTLESVAANSFEETAYFNNPHYWFNGCLYLEDVLLCAYPENPTNLKVWDNTRVIAAGAAAYSVNLTGLVLPDSVEFMGEGAFAYCTALTSVTLSNGMETIPDAAFMLCTELREIFLPASLRVIGEGAFAGNVNLGAMVLPDSLELVGTSAFELCSSLSFYGHAGTYAQQYANSNGFPFLVIADGLPFMDVAPSGVYYTEAVQYVYGEGLMTGMNPTTFAPAENLSRAHFATILYRMAGSPSVAGMDNPFEDNYYMENFYYTAAIWCNNAGILTGYYNPDGSFTGRFGPSDNITREQLATMLYRYADYIGADTSARTSLEGFGDGAAVSDFAVEALEWAAAEGIVSGRATTPPTIAPLDNASRADTAVMMQRFLV